MTNKQTMTAVWQHIARRRTCRINALEAKLLSTKGVIPGWSKLTELEEARLAAKKRARRKGKKPNTATETEDDRYDFFFDRAGLASGIEQSIDPPIWL